MTVLDGAAEEPVVLGEITLPGGRRSVAHARTFLRDLLPCGHPILADLVTVGSETVCNAVTHTASGRAGGQVRVVLLAERGAYRLEVTDDGAGGARPRLKPEDGGESGRGMRIVDALARRWGYRQDGARTVVWAEFPSEHGPEVGRVRW
ncbi:ATP-binding protein [Actinoallomurus purpureus]|uniref:ATP-binding protein n=1 Tax=Actinoallomurus purpureus TaxID=478114 RepID=UPI002093BBAD|nr:ATP-binding protein [Actinoallomurus purpureus]MCO6003975.1 ATP-binding protein [Actinoallomurus purpureus]